MKKCPFCFEEIQDEAVKCRYCNEWLDGRNTLPGLFNRTKNAIKKQIQDYKSSKTDYLNPPTLEKPLRIDAITLYTNKIEWNNQFFLFKDLVNILFKSVPHGPSSDIPYSLYFSLYFRKEGELIKKIIFWEGESNSILGKKISIKVREQLKLMDNFISKATFKSRLTKYLDEISNYGYINYTNGYKIYRNGDIFLGNENKANIKAAFDTGRLDFALTGEPYQLYIYKESGAFGVSPGTGFFTKKEGILVHFPYTVDSDIITLFLFEFLINGRELDPNILAKNY